MHIKREFCFQKKIYDNPRLPAGAQVTGGVRVDALTQDDELAATRAALVESQRKLEACSVHVTDLQLRLSGAESRVAKRDVEADRFVQDGKQTMWILNKQLETLGESLAKKEEDLSRQVTGACLKQAVCACSCG